jgi:phenylacetate-CoA ligase
VFPSQIEEQILRDPRLSGNYQIIVTRDGHLDNLEVRCELQPEVSGKINAADSQTLAKDLQNNIKTIVGVTTKISVLTAGTIPRIEVGKAKRVIDQRPKQV